MDIGVVSSRYIFKGGAMFRGKFLLIGIILSFLCVYSAETADIEGLESSSWYTEALRNIEASEYNITYDETGDIYQSPNRANNLRFYYYEDGFKVEPRESSDDWNIDIRLSSYGRMNKQSYTGGVIDQENNTLRVEGTDITIDYLNDKRGMRQDFIVNKELPGTGNLELVFEVTGDIRTEVTSNAVKFKTDSKTVMEYKNLNIYDINQKKLNGTFQSTPEGFKIVVDDIDAQYPITIDPLSTTPDWMDESDQADSYYGYSVCTAGDVNGDGYSDVIVGARYYDNGEFDEGAAFVYYGSVTGLSATPDWIGESDQIGAEYGRSAATAGDVNGDGYSDIIVGARYYNDVEINDGKIYVYFGSASGLVSATADWSWSCHQMDACLGYSAFSAGDVNGDGYSDIIAGAYFYDNGQTNEGAAFAFYGSASGLSDTADWMAESDQIGAEFGATVYSAGDVNGDGYSDVIVGAYRYTDGETEEGAAFIYHGSESGLSATPANILESNQADSHYGWRVSCAGDVNADGYSDILVSARYYDNGELDEGAAFLYLGSAVGIITPHIWMGESNQEGAHFGWAISSAGDVNSDGYSDILIGAWRFTDGELYEGEALLYYGSSSGPDTIADWIGQCDNENANYGGSVSCAGDVNGDGYSDIIIGAPEYEDGETDEGAVFVYYGSADGPQESYDWQHESNITNAQCYSVANAGDVNGDGFDDALIGYWQNDGYDGEVFVYYGSELGLTDSMTLIQLSVEGSQFGRSVSSAGDVNGDGYSDILIGAPAFSETYLCNGGAFVFKGSSYGIDTLYSWHTAGNYDDSWRGWFSKFAGDVNGDGFADIIVAQRDTAYVFLSSETAISSTPDWKIGKPLVTDGRSVSSAGDVNGDGYSDIIFGDYNQNRAYIHYGSASGLSITPDWQFTLSGAFGYSVSTAGDINGDGYSDIIVGAHTYSFGQADEGGVFIFYGSSTGVSGTPDVLIESNQASAYLGRSVSCAGDVNGDGYSDVIIGASHYDNGETDEGAAFVYLGSAAGLSTTPIWIGEGNQVSAWYGWSVSGAGDLNGDGFSDIIVSARLYDNGESNEGAAFVYYGNSEGISMKPRQLRSDASLPIVAALYSGYEDRFMIGLEGRTPMGRNKIKLQWEVKPLGTLFDGTGLSESYRWTDTGLNGVYITENVTGLTPETYYKWRVRIKYDMSKGMVQPYSRWYYISDNAPMETDLKTGSATELELLYLSGVTTDTGIKLIIDGTGDRYSIEKLSGDTYTQIGTTSNKYYIDNTPITGWNEYRVTSYENNRVITSDNINVLYIEKKQDISGTYTEIEKLNSLLRTEEYTAYTSDGRKIKEIDSSGCYYILRTIGDKVLESSKVILIIK